MGKTETEAEGQIIITPNIDERSYIDTKHLEKLSKIVDISKINFEENAKMKQPKIVIPLQNLQLKEGEDIILNCKIDGFPIPKVKKRVKNKKFSKKN